MAFPVLGYVCRSTGVSRYGVDTRKAGGALCDELAAFLDPSFIPPSVAAVSKVSIRGLPG